ncbi:MAG: formyltransferase family protein [Candidatus Contendobacter sp.]|nr:formyltransferase family protein [Candidatus Contendobacter sp.]MDG4559281.1 formyltransferase family protein [Candidatus Contendobacter sp.]
MSYKRFAVVSSTNGSVVKRTYHYDPDFRTALSLIVTDRVCGASDFAKAQNIPYQKIPFKETFDFSNSLADILKEYKIDFVLLFFTRLLRGHILSEFKGRLINFHPSLLPACPGLHGFEDTITSGSLLAGTTAHFIDDGVDTGPIIQQTFVPICPIELDEKALRHLIFLQQCASLSQVCSWGNQNRFSFVEKRRVVITDGCYDGSIGFIPTLESKISKQLLLDVA